MRRTSLILALAAIFLTGVVGFTYWARLVRSKPHVFVAPRVEMKYDAQAKRGWRYQKDDPTPNHPIVILDADAFQGTKDPSTFELKGLTLRLFSKSGLKYTLVKTNTALFDEGTGILKADGPVSVVMSVPIEVAVTDTKQLNKRVHIETSGVTYETKSGKASTDRLATFVFPEGGGHAVGGEYDPNTRVLHLRSAVSLDWIGNGPVANKVHVETTDLIYKELEQKVYLSPWSKMQRQTLTILAKGSIVSLADGRLHQIDSINAAGTDNRNGRLVKYSAATMTALFNEDGVLKEVLGERNARVSSEVPAARTLVTGDRADLVFEIADKIANGQVTSDSSLHAVTADGHAVAESQPLPMPGVLQGDTRILRSEHILLAMKPGGQEVREINAPQKATLEFKPNRSGLPHRTVDASKLQVLYGDDNYVASVVAANARTRTDKPPGTVKTKDSKPPAPAFTWSDELVAKFKAGSNSVETINQPGHFRYQEGDRRASADRAQLVEDTNRITLTNKAMVADSSGSTNADLIVMDQNSGDMDANGRVRSTHEADKNQKPGTTMLDASKAMDAQADRMQSRDNNTDVTYSGHAVIWQGANRISADVIEINRDHDTLDANGNVVSELVDNRDTGTAGTAAPIFTTVRAPKLVYRDDTKLALFTGGVTLVRDRMTVTAQRMDAYLTPQTQENKGDSSLDHAIGDGNVKIFESVSATRTRTGTGEHCEYFTKQDKVVLSGGSPQFVDSQKGITRGKQLTYFSADDKLIVEGEPAQEAFSRVKKK